MLAAVARRAEPMLASAGRRALGSVRFASVSAGLNLPAKYGHFIGGKFVEPVGGEYFDNVSPIDGNVFIQAARGAKADVDNAVTAATDAYWSTWSKASVTERSNMLLKIADIIEANADRLAKIETVDNGKLPRSRGTSPQSSHVLPYRSHANVHALKSSPTACCRLVCRQSSP